MIDNTQYDMARRSAVRTTFRSVKRVFKRGIVNLVLGLCVCLSNSAIANDGTGKDGKSYVSIGYQLNEFRSLLVPLDTGVAYDSDGDYLGRRVTNLFPETAQTYGVNFAYGEYLNDYFKTELRSGFGIKDDTVKEALDVNLAYWVSWYIGFQHPITDYMSGYIMYGVSYYEADETRRQTVIIERPAQSNPRPVLVEPSPEALEPGLFETQFSQSWILGLEFSLIDDWFLGVEYGRLIKDTDSGIKVRQAGAHLRYEF